ncbi:nucleotide pyrophosphohydrolase [Anaerostipes hadrus]|uniref:MazG-like family protein n=1 Tax=Anaerostipes hadrus TaxID=649756 RepID=UPI002FE6E56C
MTLNPFLCIDLSISDSLRSVRKSVLIYETIIWSDTEYDLQHVKEELADVIVYCQDMLDKLNLDVDEIVNMKMEQNEAKYPVEKAKGSAKKYSDL